MGWPQAKKNMKQKTICIKCYETSPLSTRVFLSRDGLKKTIFFTRGKCIMCEKNRKGIKLEPKTNIQKETNEEEIYKCPHCEEQCESFNYTANQNEYGTTNQYLDDWYSDDTNILSETYSCRSCEAEIDEDEVKTFYENQNTESQNLKST